LKKWLERKRGVSGNQLAHANGKAGRVRTALARWHALPEVKAYGEKGEGGGEEKIRREGKENERARRGTRGVGGGYRRGGG